MFSVVMRYHEDGITLVLREQQHYPVEGFTGRCLIRSSEEIHFLETHLHRQDDAFVLDLYDARDESGMGRSPLEALRRAGWQQEHVPATLKHQP